VAARGLQPGQVDVPAGWQAGLGGEGAGELARRQAGPLGQRLDRQVGRRVLGDPLLHLAERLPLRELGGELRAELRLAAGAAQEHDQLAGDGEGGVAAEVVLDQGEREVDAGRDPGRGGEGAVLDVDRVGIDGDVRVLGGEVVAALPVGGDRPPGQQPGLGQQERAGADRRQPPRPGRVAPQPADQVRVAAAGAFPAGDDHQVRRVPDGGQVGVGQQAEPAGGPHGGAAEAGGGDRVPGRAVTVGALPAGGAEHLQRPGDVEALHAVEQDNQHGLHVCQSGWLTSWQQGRKTHLFRHRDMAATVDRDP
jgi:hypothetical protein